jgi:hypothetical protein
MTHDRVVYRGGHKREGEDPVWAEPNWGAPHHARHRLLPQSARCETCRWWFHSVCAPTLAEPVRKVKQSEDRCPSWIAHPDYLIHVSEIRMVAKHVNRGRRPHGAVS